MVSKELETAILQLVATAEMHTNSSSIVNNNRLRDLIEAFRDDELKARNSALAEYNAAKGER